VLDYGWGLTNAVGLSNPGVEAEVEELRGLKDHLPPGVAFIASMFDSTVERFGLAAGALQACGPDMLEINISCPNTESDLGRMFAAEPGPAAAAIRAVKAHTSLPVIAKLSPNVTDIREIARACEDAGADGLAVSNTFGPGMVIDVTSGRPILANRTGGVSGPGIFPLALAKVYEVASAVSIPVIGIGGVMTGENVAQMIMAGATAVGVGSAAYYRPEGPESLGAIAREYEAFLGSSGHGSTAVIKGLALQERVRVDAS
jgi:dihydroorotate dehydrogenase (NAD+) catalytic subunit